MPRETPSDALGAPPRPPDGLGQGQSHPAAVDAAYNAVEAKERDDAAYTRQVARYRDGRCSPRVEIDTVLGTLRVGTGPVYRIAALALDWPAAQQPPPPEAYREVRATEQSFATSHVPAVYREEPTE